MLLWLLVGRACAASIESVALAQNGLRLAAQGLHAEAIAALEQSAALDADDNPPAASTTLVNLGLVWEEFGLPLKALESYGRALELDPSSAGAHIKFGAALETHLNEREAAVEAVIKAVELDPARGDAWNLLGQLHHSRGALDEAQDALSRAVLLVPEDDVVRRNFATALRATGRFDESLEELRRAATADGVVDEEHPSLAFAPDRVEAAGVACADDDSAAGADADDVDAHVVAVLQPSALPDTTPDDMRDTLRHVHLTRVATADECERAIAAAEAHAASRGGWDGVGHHDTHRTNDIVVAESTELSAWVRTLLGRVIWPALRAQFHLGPTDLWLEDCFVIKYEHSGQAGLGPHRDDSELSFNILLSDPASFEGGGTAFSEAEPEALTLRPRRGEMLSHYGRVMHEGRPHLRGAPRYVLAGFVRAKPLAEAWSALRLAGATEDEASAEGAAEAGELGVGDGDG